MCHLFHCVFGQLRVWYVVMLCALVGAWEYGVAIQVMVRGQLWGRAYYA